MSILHLKGEYGARSESRFACFPLRKGIVATMSVVKERRARDALPHTFNIGVFECGKTIIPR